MGVSHSSEPAGLDAVVNTSAAREPDAVTVSLASAGRGFAWSLLASVIVMAASLASQILLGWYLSSEDFGIYAIALACANFVTVFRDGGVGRWLIAKSPEAFDQDASKAYALVMVSSVVVAGTLAAVAPFAGRLYAAPAIAHVMLILAAAIPVTGYAVVASAKLQVQHRFDKLAGIKIASGIIRYGAAVILAIRGWGPASFAWPVLFCGLFENLAYHVVARLPVSLTDWRWHDCKSVLRESRWSVAGAFAAAIMRQSDYAVLGLAASSSTVGCYYFAFQLTLQPVLLLSESLRKVVLPMFGRLTGDVHREAKSLHLAGLLAGMVVAPMLLLFALLAGPLEQLVWHGRWAQAVRPMQFLACAMPCHFLSLFVESLAIARGRFRLWTASLLIRGSGAALVAGIAGLALGQDATQSIAASLAVYLALSALVECAMLLRALELPSRALWTGFVPTLASAAGAALIVSLMTESIVATGIGRLAILGVAYVIKLGLLWFAACRSNLQELSVSLRAAWSRRSPRRSS